MAGGPDSEQHHEPYSLKSPGEQARRQVRLTEQHVAPLDKFVGQIRQQTGHQCPNFDPEDGGVNARILFLLEAPGRQAMKTGFVSRNNPDQTAKQMCLLLREAELPRSVSILWNIVPWFLGTEKKIRAPRADDIEEARPWLQRLLVQLPNVETVVFVGRQASRSHVWLSGLDQRLHFAAWHHPSPRVFNRWPERRDENLAVARVLVTRS